jgi:hypothetical protein
MPRHHAITAPVFRGAQKLPDSKEFLQAARMPVYYYVTLLTKKLAVYHLHNAENHPFGGFPLTTKLHKIHSDLTKTRRWADVGILLLNVDLYSG